MKKKKIDKVIDLTATDSLKVNIDGKVGFVPRKAYVAAKTKQLQEFGYPSLTENEVNEQITAVLEKKKIGNGLTVIGGFIQKDIIIPEK